MKLDKEDVSFLVRFVKEDGDCIGCSDGCSKCVIAKYSSMDEKCGLPIDKYSSVHTIKDLLDSNQKIVFEVLL